MNRSMDTSKWIIFFTKAGLPANVAANYALIFSENRIQIHMLLDLSKEYLYDMGIRVMGDVIAILKYAKEHHNQLAQQRLIRKSSPLTNKVSIAERMVGHYTRPAIAQPVRTMASIRTIAPVPKSTSVHSKVINLKVKPQPLLPKKIRRVPPEEEGAYKIKMPLGTIEKTRKILQIQAAATKRSVFSRLGDSAVSSSTDTNKNLQISSSVFERLGGTKQNKDDMPTSTVSTDLERSKNIGHPLQYKGILKTNVGINRTVVTSGFNKSTGITRTVMQPSQRTNQTATNVIKINQINALLQQNVLQKTRLLTKTKSAVSQNVLANRFASKSNIKSRLGNKDARKIVRLKITSRNQPANSVFNRIGK